MAYNQTIQHKRSSVVGNVPAAGILGVGEIGINFPDKSIYTETPGGVVVELERDIIKSATAPNAADWYGVGTLWFDTVNTEMRMWDGTDWINIAYNGLTVNTGTLTDGLVDVTLPSCAEASTGIVTITGLAPNQYIPIVDSNDVTNASRFSVSNNTTDATGKLVFSVKFDDTPCSNAGDAYTANLIIGAGTNTLSVDAIATITAAAAPFTLVYPTGATLIASSTWTNPSTTLTATGCISLSTDGVIFF